MKKDSVRTRVIVLICGRIAMLYIRCGVHGYVERTQLKDWRDEKIAWQLAIVDQKN